MVRLFNDIMTYYDIIQIKEDGKLELTPQSAHDIGLTKGTYFLIEISPEVDEARLEKIALPGTKLCELEFVVKNQPGVLSKISGEFARHNVNIMFNESEDVNSEEAVLVAVVDVAKMDYTHEELEKNLSKMEEVLKVKLKKCY